MGAPGHNQAGQNQAAGSVEHTRRHYAKLLGAMGCILGLKHGQPALAGLLNQGLYTVGAYTSASTSIHMCVHAPAAVYQPVANTWVHPPQLLASVDPRLSVVIVPGQGAHASLLYPGLKVPTGQSTPAAVPLLVM